MSAPSSIDLDVDRLALAEYVRVYRNARMMPGFQDRRGDGES